MMLLRQLPAGSITMSVSSLSFPSIIDSMPSSTSLLLSLLASIVLLSSIRAAFLCLRTNFAKQQQQPQVPQEKVDPTGKEQVQQRRLSWAWGILSWEGLPLTLPVSLTISEGNMNGRGVGLREKKTEQQSQSWQPNSRGRRGGPAFESPLPAIYQSEEPLSMAKIIMSRHTYRKPTNRPPARPPLPSSARLPTPSPVPPPSQSPSHRRTPSMV